MQEIEDGSAGSSMDIVWTQEMACALPDRFKGRHAKAWRLYYICRSYASLLRCNKDEYKSMEKAHKILSNIYQPHAMITY